MILQDCSPRKLGVSSVEYRDGQQSLLGTRIRGEDFYPILEQVDKIGFASVEMWGGATFDVAMRYLNEDPWNRIREFKKRMPRTPLRMFLRGQNLVGYRQYPDDIVEHFVLAAASAGIDIFLIFDGLNDVRNCEAAIRAVKKAGKTAHGNIIYTVSPVHTVETFVNIALDFQKLGVSAVQVEDTAGSMTPGAAYDLISALKKALDVPVLLQCHSTAGMAQLAYWEAIRAGVDGVDLDIAALSMGTSHPPMESMIVALKDSPIETGISLEQLAPINAHFKMLREKYKEFESKFVGADVGVLQHQVPGGMMSNLELQLRQMKASNRIDEILQEVVNVRRDLGYPPLATPFSQIVGAQATVNVMTKARYKMMSTEAKELVCGRYGRVPGKIADEVYKAVMINREPITCRPADLIEPAYEKTRAECAGFARTEEDILSYALFPNIAEPFLKAKYGIK